MTWTTSTEQQGWTTDNGREVPGYGVEVAPGEWDTVNKHTLDIAEAAAYINLLSDNANRVISKWHDFLTSSDETAKEDGRIFSMALDELQQILSTDAWTQAKERVNG